MSEAIQIIGSMEIGNLRLQAGDILVIKTDRVTTPEADKRIRNNLGPILPQGVKVLVINPGVELSVITKAEIEAKVA